MLVHMPCDATEEGSQALVKLSFIHSFIQSFNNYRAHPCAKHRTALRIHWLSTLMEAGHLGPRGFQAGDGEEAPGASWGA